MLDFFYLFYLLSSLAYLFFSPKKEVPLFLLVYGLLQYAITQLWWWPETDGRIAGLLLLFIVLSTGLMLWGKELERDQDRYYATVLMRVGQWLFLVALAVVLGFKRPWVVNESLEPVWENLAEARSWGFPSFAKVGGNLLLFGFWFQVIMGWGESWSWKKSLLDLGPLLLYTVWILLILRWLPHAAGASIS